MSNVNLLSPIVLQWEGKKYTNDPLDKGGPTKMGITLNSWKSQGYDKDGDGDIDEDDVRLLTIEDFTFILKTRWDRWKADQILNQSVANLLVDWVYCSGKWGVIIPQRILKVEPDGLVGNLTIKALNQVNPRTLHQQIWSARKQFLLDIVIADPKQKKYINGWLNRINVFQFKV